MKYPKFFDDVEKILIKDDLSNFLGSFKDGIVEISYLDMVKIAGHSCPTIAGAYLITYRALNFLYPNSIPKRGEIFIEFRENKNTGTVGVMANIISNITGSFDEGGFKGIDGKFKRDNLLKFNNPQIKGIVRFTRLDTNTSIDIDYNPNIVPQNEKLKNLFFKIKNNDISNEEIKIFKELWQDRVKKILIDNFNNEKLVIINN